MATIAPPRATELNLGDQALRTPRSAGLAGVAFSLLAAVSLIVIRLGVPADPDDAGSWITDSSRRDAVLLGISLMPFAGVAFLWFLGVVRDRIGESEDRFFGTIFFGSGLLFVAMLFATAATAAGLITGAGHGADNLVASGVWSTGRYVTREFMDIGMQIAGVFTVATSTILRGTGAAPRWLVLMGYAIAACLLVAMFFFYWTALLFPFWVLLLSLHILVTERRRSRA